MSEAARIPARPLAAAIVALHPDADHPRRHRWRRRRGKTTLADALAPLVSAAAARRSAPRSTTFIIRAASAMRAEDTRRTAFFSIPTTTTRFAGCCSIRWDLAAQADTSQSILIIGQRPAVRAGHATSAAAAALIVDGIFLHRPELSTYWDLSIFLKVDFRVSVPRGAAARSDARRVAIRSTGVSALCRRAEAIYR